MWDRATLKGRAKMELKQSYWLSLGVCVVAGILGGGVSGLGSSSGSPSITESSYSNEGAIIAMLFIVLVGSLISCAASIFVTLPIEAGKSSFFARAPYGDRQFANLFSPFKSGRYMSTVKTMFLTNLFIFLWSLLFIIPGIIKAYQYCMVPYIISDDPSLTPKQAMDLSRRMTDGEKFNIFILQLSFIGWIMLGLLALGIGVIFVAPYIEATMAQLYLELRTRVILPPQQEQFPPVM